MTTEQADFVSALAPPDTGMRRLEIQTLADRACEMLDHAILNGTLPPGMQLSESELAARMASAAGRCAKRSTDWKGGA